ncbi:MAG: endonuclease V [Candidatus Bathyarchaeia archaeon]|jgi:deoxyribonuclease V
MESSVAVVEFSIQKARKAQTLMAQKVITQNRLPRKIRFVAGVDVAYAAGLAFGAASVLDYDSLEILETQTVTQHVKFPYIPTLLSFRELPACMSCIKKLKRQPDIVLVDAQGLAHPYKLGLASHLGVVLDMPTAGVAKDRLVGEVRRRGEEQVLVFEGEVIGAVVHTQKDAKPVYVSVGHKVSLTTAVEIVKHCIRYARVPEPILAAHKLASAERKAKIEAATTTGAGEHHVECATQRNSRQNPRRQPAKPSG